MSYRLLGRTGLLVHPLCLGTMNFGHEGWGCDEAAAREILAAYLDRGGNFIDTANRYGAGRSEEIVGRFLEGRRHEVVLATKCFFPEGEGPNQIGLSRKNIFEQVEASLRRLRTDYIDLYQVHVWDPLTPIEETLSALSDLVHQGKVRYLGCCNFTGWQIVLAQERAAAEGLEGFVSTQPQYNLLCRDIEIDVIPACEEYDLGILAWSPLAFGLLTGKYDRRGGPPGARLSDPAEGDIMQPWKERLWTEASFDTIEALGRIAAELDTTPVAVALSWILEQEQLTSAIIGPRDVEQLDGNWQAVTCQVPEELLEELDERTAPHETYLDFMQGAVTLRRIRHLE
jgi:aryl-alcohol dehydrogenase-like predicted oxidoreductase